MTPDELDGKLLRVGPFQYPVEADQQTMIVAGTNGAHLGDQQKILFDPTLAPEQLQETILHESIHASIHTSNIRDVIFADVGDADKEEEKLVRPLSMILFGMLRANPWFVDYLMEGTGYRLINDPNKFMYGGNDAS